MSHRERHANWFGIAGSRGAFRLLIFAIPIVIAKAAFGQFGAQDAWQNVSQCTDTVDVEMFIAEFPNSEFVEKARDCLAKLGDSRSVSPAGSDARTRSGGMNDPVQVGLEARITELQAENREKEILLEDALALLAASDAQLQSAHGSISALESDLGQTRDDLASSLRMISELEAVLSEMRDERDVNREDMAALEAVLSETRNELEVWQRADAELDASLSDARRELERDDEDAATLESGLKEARLETLELRSRMAALETLLVSVRTQLADSRQSEDALETDLIRSNEELEASRSSTAKLEAQLEATRRELSEVRINLAQFREALSGTQAELWAAQQEATETQQELAVTRDELGRTQGERAAALAEIESIRTAFSLSQAELESTLDEMGKVRDEFSSTLGLLADTRIDLSGVREELSDVRAGARSSQDHIETLLATLSERSGELATARFEAASKDNEIVELRRRLVALEDELVALSREVRSLTTDLADRETALAAAEEERDRIRQTTGLTQEELQRALQNLNEAERARLAEAAAAELLRRRLQDSEAELTAMTLVLENERKEAEEVIAQLAESQSAEDRYAEVQAISEERAQQILLLNRQITELREQLRELDAFVEDAVARDVASEVEIANLGRELNQALARAAAEQKKRADLEERERRRLEAEAQDLRRFHSEFLAQLQDVLGGREGVMIVGDRFVFSSEILFGVGSDVLGDTGKEEIRRVSEIIKDVAVQIPPEVDWILRVDGHTDNTPVRASLRFGDNWQLSSARALSVVRYMIDELGIPANRLSANGFGEHQPITVGDDPVSLAQNRRIEIKFTER